MFAFEGYIVGERRYYGQSEASSTKVFLLRQFANLNIFNGAISEIDTQNILHFENVGALPFNLHLCFNDQDNSIFDLKGCLKFF